MILRAAAILTASTAAIIPLSITTTTHAFTLTSTSQKISHYQNIVHRRRQRCQGTNLNGGYPYSLERRMSTGVSTESNSNDVQNDENGDSNNGGEEEWWKSFQLKDYKLAETVRNDFPILTYKNHFVDDDDEEEETKKELIYFDSAATSQKPHDVINKLTSYYESINSNVHRGAHTLSQRATTEYEGARDKVAKFINANSRNEVIFTSGATEALNLVAATYGRANLKEGDEVLISELEHHSNIVPWQMLVEEIGATLKFIPIDAQSQCLKLGNDSNDDDDDSILGDLITSKTKIVSIQHVSNVLACIHPVDKIVSEVRKKAADDCIIILDACQSIPHMPVDVQKLGVDFIAASGHKMCAPTGIGFLWGKEHILNSMPPYMGGGEMIDEVYMDRSTYAPAPARFEAGTPQIAQAIGLGAAVDYLENVAGGMERIHNYEHELGEYLMRRMEEVEGVTVLGPELGVDRAAIVAFVCDGVHPSDLSTFLDMEGVAIRAGHHCCQPMHRALGYSHSARASLYFYNTKEEVDSFISILKETLAFLGGAGGEGVDDDFVPFI